MKKFAPGTRFQFDARRLSDGGTPDKVLILDGHNIEKYRCRFDVAGIDLSEFERTGRQGFWNHDTSAPPVCEWETWIENNAWWGKPTFHTDNPQAAVIAKLWKADKINAVSAGVEVLETIDAKDEEYTTISRCAPFEVSIVNFGAHPHAGKGLSMALSAAVAEGVITEDEASSITGIVQDAEPLPTVAEFTALKGDVVALRETVSRLQAELAAKGTPAPEQAIDLEKINAPASTITPEQAKAALAEALRSTLDGQVAAMIRAAVRKHLGRID